MQHYAIPVRLAELMTDYDGGFDAASRHTLSTVMCQPAPITCRCQLIIPAHINTLHMFVSTCLRTRPLFVLFLAMVVEPVRVLSEPVRVLSAVTSKGNQSLVVSGGNK